MIGVCSLCNAASLGQPQMAWPRGAGGFFCTGVQGNGQNSGNILLEMVGDLSTVLGDRVDLISKLV
jgi:hypothetical protein